MSIIKKQAGLSSRTSLASFTSRIEGDLWEVHDRDKRGTTFLYGLDAKGNVTDVDVEYPKAEAARRKRQAKEADRKVAAALRRGKRRG